MNERLLTRAEWEAIVNGLSDGSTCRNCREAITEAQDAKTLRAVATMLSRSIAWFGVKLMPNEQLKVLSYIREGKWEVTP